jgi:adenylosuccinate lyase
MRGMDRQVAHRLVQGLTDGAWEDVLKGHPSRVAERLSSDRRILSKISPGELTKLMDPLNHVGNAEARCQRFVEKVLDPIVSKYGK